MSFSLLESKKPALMPLSLNWARAEVLVEAMARININLLNLLMTMTFSYTFSFWTKAKKVRNRIFISNQKL